MLTLSLIAIAVGCAGRNARPATQREPAILEIDNRRFSDMVVYAVDGSRRVRIGTVTGNTASKFRIPANIVGIGREVQFLADPVGGQRTGISERMFVRPGETLKLTILP
jgi:hypothetical protein